MGRIVKEPVEQKGRLMRSVAIWLGLILAVLVLVFHVAHIAAEFEFIFLDVSVILIGLGVAPFPG